jgi:uncharacterized glyoxalase superfamily protein PhnB
MSRPNALLDQVNIVSSNLEASIAFYRRLGVEFPEGRVWSTGSGIHHASAGETENPAIDFDLDSMAFARIWNKGWQGRQDLSGRVVVGFKLSSREAVDDAYGDLIGAGYTGLQAPYDAFWGSRYAVVEDPDGVAVGLMSPPSAERRSAPPEV